MLQAREEAEQRDCEHDSYLLDRRDRAAAAAVKRAAAASNLFNWQSSGENMHKVCEGICGLWS
jgi:hypothetical protein